MSPAQAPAPTQVGPVESGPAPTCPRDASIDTLKVVLVTCVILGHTTIAWTGMGNWVFYEPPVREPLLSLLSLFLVAAMFAMGLFFTVAGLFTPPSLERKGLRRFLVDRIIRLGLPMAFFVVFFSPLVEYVDADNAGWNQGFWAFVPEIWWPPAPGPTWFLGVLLVFSAIYAATRSIWPRVPGRARVLTWRILLGGWLLVALASFVIRLWVPLGNELWRLSLPQAPGWVFGFALGVIGAEQGWFDPIDRTVVRGARRVAVAALAVSVATLVTTSVLGADLTPFTGGDTWQSLLMSTLEGALIVSMPLWILDLFRRRFGRQGPVLQQMSRSAFVAFVIHQVVLVGLILLSRFVRWAPEVEWLLVSALGVGISFGLGGLLLRIPGVARVM